MHPVDVQASGQIQPEDARRQIETICGSYSFRHRESFRKLLTYLADRTLEGSAESLKEYTVGVELLGKPETYDPREDATVRVQISKLRQKLEEYYLGEGREDVIVVELPRRQIGLTFHFRQQPLDIPAAPAPSAVVEPGRGQWNPRLWQIGAGAAVLCATAFLIGRQFAPGPTAAAKVSAAAPEVEQFWQPLLGDGRPVLASLGTPMFVRFRGARVRAGHEDFETAKTDSRIKHIQTLFDSPDIQPSYIYTGVGEATAAFEISKLFTRWNVDVQLRRNASLTWDDISNNNLIILGSAKYNPHIRHLPVEQAFLVEAAGVTNLRPGPGEPPKFLRKYAGDPDRSIIEDYAVVSRLPGVNGRGAIIVLGASATEGTAAAVAYLTDAAQLRDLFQRMRNASGQVPKYFEAVLRVEFRSMVPVATHYQTHREVKP
jgi:hypothetical protein